MRRWFAAAALSLAATAVRSAAAQSPDPLPSWNEGAAKKAIVDFIKITTDRGESQIHSG